MKYTNLLLKNFKGIQDLTIDLEKQPLSKIITLVGLNESGKTSILQAINLLKHDIDTSERHKLIPKKDKLNFTGTVSVEAHLKVSDEDNKSIIEKLKGDKIEAVKPISEFTILKEYRFKDSQFVEAKNIWNINIEIKKEKNSEYITVHSRNVEWLNIVTFLRDKMIPKIIFYTDFLFDFPAKIYLDQETSEEKNQIQFRNIIQDILASIDKKLTIEDHIVKRLKDSTDAAKESLDHTLSKMSSQISKVVLGAWKNIMNISGKEIFVEAKSERLNKMVKKEDGFISRKKTVYYLEFRLKEGSEKYFISERSLGFKWFFTFLLFTEFRKNRKTDIGETLFLLDEPASNLHSTAQKKLLDKFSDLSKSCRLIYTTHSHHLINPMWLNGTYIIKNRALNYNKIFEFDSNETNIEAILYKNFVSKNPKQQDYFQPILDSLEYQPGLLEKIPRIVITEGKFDFYIIKYVNEVLLNKKYKNINLYPGNGADSNDQVIRLYLAWGREFKILLDGDEGGKKAKIRYLKLFGESINDDVITFLDINKEWNFSIENMFTDIEKVKITQLFDKTLKKFDKSKFNTSIQNLYVTNTAIELSDATINRFETLLKAINR